MTERTFTHGSIVVTVHRAKVRDRLVRDTVLGKLQREGIGDPLSRYAFATAVAQSTVTGLTWADANTPVAALADVYEAWMNLDAAVYDEWQGALEIVSMPMNDPDLVPPQNLTVEKKEP